LGGKNRKTKIILENIVEEMLWNKKIHVEKKVTRLGSSKKKLDRCRKNLKLGLNEIKRSKKLMEAKLHSKNFCVTFHKNPVFESSNRVCVNFTQEFV
jgi:hypothetical protein